ncbi:sulfatase [Pararhodobacter marinus]|uniref:Sulfatase n=1 Tax=Pararhodobacter marinus TaxID=2184063 RepID=A0A2U2CF36_9RHOB|nr:sulfatase-like hydrolase/transferase [Pararhodobacter marinus]PWE30394.1 sulfatase [Pararhodobacter marinus]
MERPNFLYIMTDQHRADWLGCAGHPVVKTPNIDALAARGTRFSDFHVASPVCMPNRASFMTGRYPSQHGLRYNGCLLPRRARTFVDLLREAGYRTASIGKSHLQPFTESPPPNAGSGPEAWQPDDGDYGCEAPDRYEGARYDFPTPYYGFDHVEMVTGHGPEAGGHYRQWFRDTYPEGAAWQGPENQLPHAYSVRQGVRTAVPEEAYPTAYIRDRAVAYLRANAGSDAPLFTYVSFPDPHHPFNPPGKYWDMYDPDDFTVFPRYEDHKNPPPPLQAVRADYEAGRVPPRATGVFMANDREVREAMALTAGMITMIDDAVGALVAALKETGQYDNTIIVFNSDHGDYLGDFNVMLKGGWSLDAINRVPMIWADPSAPTGTESTALASTLDMSATILARAGIDGYFGMMGRSLLPCMAGGDDLRDALLIEYNDGFVRMGFRTQARVRTLVTRDWHLAMYKGEAWGELYDRRADPHQTHNLWDAPEHAQTKAALMERLVQEMMGLMDESPRHTRVA